MSMYGAKLWRLHAKADIFYYKMKWEMKKKKKKKPLNQRKIFILMHIFTHSIDTWVLKQIKKLNELLCASWFSNF